LNENGDSVIKRIDHFAGKFGRLRDICISPDGRVFISTSNKDGRGSIQENDDKIIEISNGLSNVKKKDDKQVGIYPNPNNGVINFLNLDGDNNYFLNLYDFLGNKLLDNIAVNTFNSIDLKVLIKQNSLNGIYYVILHNDSFRIFEKLIINDGIKVK